MSEKVCEGVPNIRQKLPIISVYLAVFDAFTILNLFLTKLQI